MSLACSMLSGQRLEMEVHTRYPVRCDALEFAFGFFGDSRTWLKQTVREIGSRYSGHLIRGDVSHLVLHEDEGGEPGGNAEGQKVVKAREWGIEVVGREWLREVVRARSVPLPRQKEPADTAGDGGNTGGEEDIAPMEVSLEPGASPATQEEDTLLAEAEPNSPDHNSKKQEREQTEASVLTAGTALGETTICKKVDDDDTDVGELHNADGTRKKKVNARWSRRFQEVPPSVSKLPLQGHEEDDNDEEEEEEAPEAMGASPETAAATPQTAAATPQTMPQDDSVERHEAYSHYNKLTNPATVSRTPHRPPESLRGRSSCARTSHQPLRVSCSHLSAPNLKPQLSLILHARLLVSGGGGGGGRVGPVAGALPGRRGPPDRPLRGGIGRCGGDAGGAQRRVPHQRAHHQPQPPARRAGGRAGGGRGGQAAAGGGQPSGVRAAQRSGQRHLARCAPDEISLQ
eukprot:1194846-Prorocentrum_minimum.AAC.6